MKRNIKSTSIQLNESVGADEVRIHENANDVRSNLATAWLDYVIDAAQRAVLFLDLLRRRGNEEIEITSRSSATVLYFDHEVVMSGRDLERPINYSLMRILPPDGVTIVPQ